MIVVVLLAKRLFRYWENVTNLCFVYSFLQELCKHDIDKHSSNKTKENIDQANTSSLTYISCKWGKWISRKANISKIN